MLSNCWWQCFLPTDFFAYKLFILTFCQDIWSRNVLMSSYFFKSFKRQIFSVWIDGGKYEVILSMLSFICSYLSNLLCRYIRSVRMLCDLLSMTLHKKWSFSIKDFFNKCDQMSHFLRIWSHLLKKSLMEKFIFCAVWFDILPFISIILLIVFSLLHKDLALTIQVQCRCSHPEVFCKNAVLINCAKFIRVTF